MRELDIRPDDIIVVYDYNRPMPISPRASWMFRAFGAQNVHVLDGNFYKWLNEDHYPIMTGQKSNEAFTRLGRREPAENPLEFILNEEFVTNYN
jgi:3-mercaptopyruvate sulfurtransferase SseA